MARLVVKRPAFKRHHHQDVGVGIPASIAASLGSKQDDFLWRELFHQIPGKGLQSLAAEPRALLDLPSVQPCSTSP